MTVRAFLAASAAAFLASWGILALIVNWLDPTEAAGVGYMLFFMTFFLCVASTAALAGYGLRRLISPLQFSAYRVRNSLRQALLLGVFADILLLLQLLRLARWWLVLLLLIVFVCLEFIFLSYDRAAARHRHLETES